MTQVVMTTSHGSWSLDRYSSSLRPDSKQMGGGGHLGRWQARIMLQPCRLVVTQALQAQSASIGYVPLSSTVSADFATASDQLSCHSVSASH